MPSKPLHISLHKSEIYKRKRAFEVIMDAGIELPDPFEYYELTEKLKEAKERIRELEEKYKK